MAGVDAPHDGEAPAAEAKPPWPEKLTLLAVFGGLLLVVPLSQANLELDHKEPHQAPALLLLLATLALAVPLGVTVVRWLRLAQGSAAGLCGVALGLPATALAMEIATDYGRESHGFRVLDFSGEHLAFVLFIYAFVFLVVGAAAGVLALLRVPRWPGMMLTAVGIAIGTSVALAAITMLVTFPDQVREAREANRDTAAPALMAVAALLLASAAWRRRG